MLSHYRTERVVIVTTLLLVGLGLALALSRGAIFGGSDQAGLFVWLMALVLVLIAASGAWWLRRGVLAERGTDLPAHSLPVVRVPLYMVVPAVMAVGFVLFLQFFDNGIAQALIVLLAGGAFGTLYLAQAHVLHSDDRYFGLAQSALNVLSHLTGFLVFSVIYGLKARAAISSTAVGLFAALLIYELLARDAAWHTALGLPSLGRRRALVLLSLASGLVLAEVAWGLNYWAALTMVVGGAMLLVLFYVIHGLVAHYVDRTLTRDVTLEFGVVGAIATIVVFLSAFLG